MKFFQWTVGAAVVTAAFVVFIALEGPAALVNKMGHQQAGVGDNGNKSDEQQVVQAVEGAKSIQRTMKNPDSLKLESMVIMPSGVVCYVYLSKNEAGGMAKGAAVLLKGEIKTNETQGFDLCWRDECQGKKGNDVTGFGELMVY